MNRRADFRSFIACAVAYAIAIQAALLGLTVATAAGSTSAAILCSDRAPADTSVPANHEHGADMLCCIAAGCGGSAGLPAGRAAIGPIEGFVVKRDLAVIPSDEFTGWPSERPKSSRAPPV